MATFLTRVELHAADSGDYDRLHEEMAKRGFRRTLLGSDGKYYMLPTAEYESSGDYNVEAVRDSAQAAVQTTGRTGWVISVRYDLAAWFLPKL